MKAVPLIEDEAPFKTAKEFIAALSMHHDGWPSPFANQNSHVPSFHWVFRGQGDADWKLTPVAHRRPQPFMYRGIGAASRERSSTLETQLGLEHRAVIDFVRGCTRAGLTFPEDGPWIRNNDLLAQVAGPKHSSGAEFPSPYLRAIYALAQHHGVPTRLLDWSQSPLVAAYFACRPVAEAVKREKNRLRKAALRDRRRGPELPLQRSVHESRRLAVWALCAHAWTTPRPHGIDPAIEIVEVPNTTNPNLRAQQGLFTLVTFTNGTPVRRLPTVEDVIASCQSTAKLAYGYPGPWLRKLTLPYAQAPNLLRWLDQYNINAATIYPGYDSVQRSIRDREFFD